MKKILSFLSLSLAICFFSSCASQRCDCPKVEKPAKQEGHLTANGHDFLKSK